MNPAGAWGGSRRLLRRLRDVMALPAGAQERLDQVVRLIAADMVAEVCSIYLVRAGDLLELFATTGLRPESVHRTRLRVGEGLVGTIAANAAPLALADAQRHPAFAYRPETGEEIYHSLMGVPVLRAGRVLGVLAVQNCSRRHYTDEEIEALQTIAMVLAELAASGALVSPEEQRRIDGLAQLPERLTGMRVHGGVAMGTAVLHHPDIVIHTIVGEDPQAELERLEGALAAMHEALDRLVADPDLSAEHREVLETYRMFAQDAGWRRRIEDAIATGLTAEAAVAKVHDDTRARMLQASDPYLRERLMDLQDLAYRLLQHLGAGAGQRRDDLPGEIVLVARNLGPAELLDYEPESLRALVLEEASATAHVAIVARALDIPVLARVGGVLDRVDAGDPLIVDGDNGQVFVRPRDDVRDAVAQTIAGRAERRAAYDRLRNLPAESRDGVRVSLSINAGLLVDMQQSDAVGADGIGLYRTEIPFMVRSRFPDVEEQAGIYRQVMDTVGDRPLVFRTLDIGGDKLLPYQGLKQGENPAMGWRAIRIAIDRPSLLRKQMRAMLLAAAGRPLTVMFPMVAELAEFRAARRIVDLEIARHRGRGGAVPAVLRLGVMLEVPSLIWQLPTLLHEVDFVSVGSNDLLQFLFAQDRSDPGVADRYDALSSPALAMLRHVVDMCVCADVPVTVCGEIAGRPLEAMALIGLGYRRLSMAPGAVGPVKAMVRALEVDRLADYLRRIERQGDHSVRNKLAAWARDHGVPV